MTSFYQLSLVNTGYDQLQGFFAFRDYRPTFSSSDYQNDVTGLIVHYLHLDSASLVVDLGAGVCTMASKVAKIASLEHPVLCVDPSMEMLEIGKELPGVKTLHMSAEEWAGTKEENVSIAM